MNMMNMMNMNRQYVFIIMIFMILCVGPLIFGMPPVKGDVKGDVKGEDVGRDIERLGRQYIDAWRGFYPSQALAAGDIGGVGGFEDFSSPSVAKWSALNQSLLKRLEGFRSHGSLPLADGIDVRLLRRWLVSEIEKWEKDRRHEHSPELYADAVSQGFTYLVARGPGKAGPEAILARVRGIGRFCDSARKTLKNGSPELTRKSVPILKQAARFYRENLPQIIAQWFASRENAGVVDKLKAELKTTAARIDGLVDHIERTVMPRMDLPDVLGEADYRRKLKIYADFDITPVQLERIALEEIGGVRDLMLGLAGQYWRKRYPGEEMPGKKTEVLNRALVDMEADREGNRGDFLKLFKGLIDRSEDFVRREGIVTLPEKRTLFTDLSPSHFAGAAVGGVYPAGCFDPEADTLLYVPSIPDSASQGARDGFYRSFNNHFNTMIITHEIVPGHYLQLKIAARHPRRVRSLFADDLYVEGWATLCEELMLDAGWSGHNILTRLAHLRKRLENAVRAYTSVQVHCRGWKRGQVSEFAVKRGLLPPQFAENLWDRVMASPLQLTSYFLGYRVFSELYRGERVRLGKQFRLREFCDRILEAGAVPTDLLPRLLREDKK